MPPTTSCPLNVSRLTNCSPISCTLSLPHLKRCTLTIPWGEATYAVPPGLQVKTALTEGA